MTENVMTAQELAEFRAWLNRRAPYSPDDEEFLPVRVTSLHALLATVDALTQRAERAEGELAEKEQARQEAMRRFGEVCDEWDRLKQDLDEALAAKERAEARVTELETLHSEVRALMIKHKDGEAAALALADARGRALEEIAGTDFPCGGVKPLPGPRALAIAREALQITAPEALRQQQEREKGGQ
jgi:hypothetical protein